MPDVPIGDLIRLHRIDRKKTTTSVATHAGITVRYLEMIEAGTKTPTLHVLRQLAKVLGVRTSALLGEAPSESYGDDGISPYLAKIERALFTYESVPLETSANDANLPDRIEAAADAWYKSENAYNDVLMLLPGLIVETEQAIRESDHSPEICKAGYALYLLVHVVLKHSGRIDLCSLVADRCMRLAAQADDPTTLAAATWSLAHAMLSGDMPQAALDVALVAAERMEPRLADAGIERLSVYGGLVQCASIAAVRTGDPWRARDLLRDKAMPSAERVGDGHSYHNTFFGPTNVGIHAAAVEIEAGDMGEALRLADRVDISRIESLERRCSHMYHVAKIYEHKGNDAAVLIHLKMAERMRWQDFRIKSELRNTVRTLLRRARPSYASEVREFAHRIGLLD